MQNEREYERREFLGLMMASGTGLVFREDLLRRVSPEIEGGEQGLVILFQGDSITDGNRSRDKDWNHVLGHGYAYLVASHLGCDYPSRRFQFYNRGISGNRVTDLATRWETDTIAIEPGLLSILIGVNDLESWLNGDASCNAENFERSYRELLHRTRQGLPTVKLVLCEPFVLSVGRVKERWQDYQAAIGPRQEIVRKLAKEFDGLFVAFQQTFNEALQKASADYWIWDGIHPMPAGHELMARTWIKSVRKKWHVT
jgi:lysophospholipase L1-like esterase